MSTRRVKVPEASLADGKGRCVWAGREDDPAS